ncbi:MAG: pyruvoyl-dependent arginine decarboxylase [Candidatus Nezhaarchaeota archaeon]|nr:pyruvoyl-dependent arginine decarboxylase [Candidatus Nezhaarchaeota archaeon]
MSSTYNGLFLPRKFFVTGGKAINPKSPLNAFDEALMDAGIAQYNIVPVSSIVPPDAVEVSSIDLTPGAVVFAVLARMDGVSGETISAGVAWGWARRPNGYGYGLVAEAYGHKGGRALEEELRVKVEEMAKVRGMEVEGVRCRVESIERVPEGTYGCVVAAFVYLPVDATLPRLRPSP